MFRFIVLLTVFLTLSAADDVDFKKCVKILQSQKHCCKVPTLNKTALLDDDIRECKLMPNIPGSCEKQICFASKMGLANADGIINMDKLQKDVEKKLDDHKDILDAVNKKCYNDKYKAFGEPDECDLNKISHCILWQYVFMCPDFSEDEQCKEFKEMGAKCLALDV